MPIRRFDGVDDFIRAAIGSCNWTFGTFGALYRPLKKPAGRAYVFCNHTSANANQPGINHISATLKPFLNGSWSADRSITYELAINTWYIVLITKATGTQTPRLHAGKWNGSAFEWTHENYSGTETNPPSQAGGSIVIGASKGTTEFLNADYAAVIEWPSTVLSDAECEALGTQADLKTGWKEYKSPAGLITFEQTSVSEEVQDIIGAADQTERTGTEVISEEPPIPYVAEEGGGGVPPVRGSLNLLGVGR